MSPAGRPKVWIPLPGPEGATAFSLIAGLVVSCAAAARSGKKTPTKLSTLVVFMLDDACPKSWFPQGSIMMPGGPLWPIHEAQERSADAPVRVLLGWPREELTSTAIGDTRTRASALLPELARGGLQKCFRWIR